MILDIYVVDFRDYPCFPFIIFMDLCVALQDFIQVIHIEIFILEKVLVLMGVIYFFENSRLIELFPW